MLLMKCFQLTHVADANQGAFSEMHCNVSKEPATDWSPVAIAAVSQFLLDLMQGIFAKQGCKHNGLKYHHAHNLVLWVHCNASRQKLPDVHQRI